MIIHIVTYLRSAVSRLFLWIPVLVRKICVTDFDKQLGLFLGYIYIYIYLLCYDKQAILLCFKAFFYFTCIFFGREFGCPNGYTGFKNPLDMVLLQLKFCMGNSLKLYLTGFPVFPENPCFPFEPGMP